MYQTHSNKVIFINSKNKNNKKFNCDALLTNIKGLALGVVTADCVPILIYDFKKPSYWLYTCGVERCFTRNNRKHD